MTDGKRRGRNQRGAQLAENGTERIGRQVQRGVKAKVRKYLQRAGVQ